MTLILRKEGDVYSGTVTDSIGLANEAELTSCEFKDNVLTVQFNVFDGQNTNAVRCVLRLEGEYLVGTWETDSGVLGEIKLERKA